MVKSRIPHYWMKVKKVLGFIRSFCSVLLNLLINNFFFYFGKVHSINKRVSLWWTKCKKIPYRQHKVCVRSSLEVQSKGCVTAIQGISWRRSLWMTLKLSMLERISTTRATISRWFVAVDSDVFDWIHFKRRRSNVR